MADLLMPGADLSQLLYECFFNIKEVCPLAFKSMLTLKQKRIFDYIQAYFQKNGYSPLHEEMRKHFKLSSVSTVNHYMKILQLKVFQNYGQRTIRHKTSE